MMENHLSLQAFLLLATTRDDVTNKTNTTVWLLKVDKSKNVKLAANNMLPTMTQSSDFLPLASQAALAPSCPRGYLALWGKSGVRELMNAFSIRLANREGGRDLKNFTLTIGCVRVVFRCFTSVVCAKGA